MSPQSLPERRERKPIFTEHRVIVGGLSLIAMAAVALGIAIYTHPAPPMEPGKVYCSSSRSGGGCFFFKPEEAYTCPEGHTLIADLKQASTPFCIPGSPAIRRDAPPVHPQAQP